MVRESVDDRSVSHDEVKGVGGLTQRASRDHVIVYTCHSCGLLNIVHLGIRSRLPASMNRPACPAGHDPSACFPYYCNRSLYTFLNMASHSAGDKVSPAREMDTVHLQRPSDFKQAWLESRHRAKTDKSSWDYSEFPGGVGALVTY